MGKGLWIIIALAGAFFTLYYNYPRLAAVVAMVYAVVVSFQKWQDTKDKKTTDHGRW